MFRCSGTDEARKGVDGAEPLIARGDTAMPLLFDMVQESSYCNRRKLVDRQPVDWYAAATTDERQE